jgi:hypothetical protein
LTGTCLIEGYCPRPHPHPHPFMLCCLPLPG